MALSAAPLRIFKFVIQPFPHDRRVDPELHLEWSGHVALAVASSREQAFGLLQQQAMEEGEPWQWLLVADVIELPVAPGRLLWAQF